MPAGAVKRGRRWRRTHTSPVRVAALCALPAHIIRAAARDWPDIAHPPQPNALRANQRLWRLSIRECPPLVAHGPSQSKTVRRGKCE